MAEKLQKKGKEVLKRLVKQRKGKVSKTARIYLPKTEVFRPKREDWNLWHFSEDDIVHAAQDQDSWSRLKVDCSLVYDDNDDYQWFPAEFRN